MNRSESPPRAGSALAHMLEERRRLRRQQILLEGALREVQEEYRPCLREKQRQESRSGWCTPDLAARTERLRDFLNRIWDALSQVRQAIRVTSEEVDRLLRNRWQEGRAAVQVVRALPRRVQPERLPRPTPGLRRLHG